MSQKNSSVDVCCCAAALGAGRRAHTGLTHWRNSSAHTCLFWSLKHHLLRVLGKIQQFKTAGHPYCPVHPCAAAVQGKGTGSKGSDQMCGCSQWALAEVGSVCVLGGVCLSADCWGNTHRQTPNSKALICITLSICTYAPSFQQHP